MTTAQMIKVMLAYERSEQIEYIPKDLRSSADWTTMTQEPEWNWAEFDYRVKPKPTCRPYKNAAEFLAAQKEHGMYIRPKDSTSRYELPTSVDDGMVVFLIPIKDNGAYPVCYHYDTLLADKVWQDGTPCGVKEE